LPVKYFIRDSFVKNENLKIIFKNIIIYKEERRQV